eukprot:6179669-Pleurochrysis_carterae.AAC.2
MWRPQSQPQRTYAAEAPRDRSKPVTMASYVARSEATAPDEQQSSRAGRQALHSRSMTTTGRALAAKSTS